MKERRPEILYSDPVKEILGNPPAKILRWGTTVMFSIFILFVLFAWVLKYPDTIPSPVIITTTNPPVTLVSKISGKIKHLYVKEQDLVEPGQLVAVMETSASITEISVLKNVVDTISRPELLQNLMLPSFSELGELQESYASFLKMLSDLNNYNKYDFYGSRITSLNTEISRIQEYLNRLAVNEKLYSENEKLESLKFNRDSLLYTSSAISSSALEISRQSLIRTRIELGQVRLDHSTKMIEMSEKQQLLQDFKINRIEERGKIISALNESYLNLKAQLRIWENNYLLKSPVKGTVTFTKFWNSNQSVLKDEAVMSIIPVDHGDFIGRINLKMQRSGKVKPGQSVNIKLTGFPYLEYGMVRGVVRSKSLVPAGDTYIIEISLPDGLKTLYGTKLDFTQNMQGTAEVMTENVRLLQKIVNPFRYMISKNRNN